MGKGTGSLLSYLINNWHGNSKVVAGSPSHDSAKSSVGGASSRDRGCQATAGNSAVKGC
jgi:hypothetical protein